MKTVEFRDLPVMYHGLAAFSGGKSGLSVFKKWRALESLSGTVCVADKPIGKVGVMLQGEIRFIFSGDVWSTLEERENDDFPYQYEGFKTAGCDLETVTECLRKLQASQSYANYAEGWMRDPTIVGIWVSHDASEAHKKAARVIARRNNLCVRFLEEGEQL